MPQFYIKEREMDPAVIAFFAIGGVGFILVLAVSLLALFISVAYENGKLATGVLVGALVLMSVLCGVPIFKFALNNFLWVALATVGYLIGGVVWSFPRWRIYLSDQLENLEDAMKLFRKERIDWENEKRTSEEYANKCTTAADAVREKFKDEVQAWAAARNIKLVPDETDVDGRELIVPDESRHYTRHYSGLLRDYLSENKENDGSYALAIEINAKERLRCILRREPVWRDWLGRYPVGLCSGCGCAEKPLAANHKKDILRWMTYWPFSALWSLIDDFVRKIFTNIYRALQDRYQRMSDRLFDDAKVKQAVAELQAMSSKKESTDLEEASR